jgi:hypothetical protein
MSLVIWQICSRFRLATFSTGSSQEPTFGRSTMMVSRQRRHPSACHRIAFKVDYDGTVGPCCFSPAAARATQAATPPRCRDQCDKFASPHIGSQAQTTALHPLETGASTRETGASTRDWNNRRSARPMSQMVKRCGAGCLLDPGPAPCWRAPDRRRHLLC